MLIIRLFYNFIPVQWLPPLRKCVNGEHLPLTEKETRERYAESVTNRIYYIIQNNWISRRVKYLIEKRVRRRHYIVIGELCVAFSSLEQFIKSIIRLPDPNADIDWRSGDGLKKSFKRIFSKSPIDEEIINHFSELLEEFSKIAEQRNEVLKSSYTYNISNRKIERINLKIFSSLHKYPDWDEYMSEAVKEFSEQETKELIKSVNNLHSEFIKIYALMTQKYIFHDGKIYMPSQAKNIGDVIYPLEKKKSS